LNITLILLYC